MNSVNVQAIQDSTQLLGAAFTSHKDDIQSPEVSIVLMGAPTPGMAETLIRADGDRRLHIRLIEADRTLSECAVGIQEYFGSRMVIHQSALSDLKMDPRHLEEQLRMAPCRDLSGWNAALKVLADQTRSVPLIDDESADMVVMEMLLNRLTAAEANQAMTEAFRVLRRKGKLLMTVLLADEFVACGLPISLDGRTVTHFPVETALLKSLAHCGYHAVHIRNSEMSIIGERNEAELGVFVVEASKGKQGACLDQGDAVMFRGPWSEAYDDDGHRYVRGERTAVCAKTYALLMQAPYKDFFIGVPGRNAPILEEAPAFDCATPRLRDPRVTKGLVELGSNGGSEANCC